MKVYSVHDNEFKKYGKVIDCPFFDVFEKETSFIEMPESGCSYLASVKSLETDETNSYYRVFFGDMDIQVGYCWGYNYALNALEWHKSSEINCAIEDMILLLGDLREMDSDGFFDTQNVKAFLLKK